MTQASTPSKGTNWGCLSILIGVTLYIVWGRIQDVRYENQPIEVRLRNIFKQSGFSVPDYVTDLDGSKGDPDFLGDYEATVTFTVRSGEIETFMHLPTKYWNDPSAFKPLEKTAYCGNLEVSPGSFMIEEWASSDYFRKYAVNKTTNRIYFYRSSS